MKRLPSLALALCLLACPNEGEQSDAEVGGDRSGCGDPGSHSALLDDHSCVCEPGYAWCSEAIDDFDCCPSADETETGEPPDAPCGQDQLEQIACIDDPEQPGPGRETWACNGEAWVSVPNLVEFECISIGYHFGYGCLAAIGSPTYVCGYGPGSPCAADQASVCVDESIIDTCVWGRRTIDYCRRLCVDLQLWGPGFTTGECVEPSEGAAMCVCG
ncbi:hypothetical protein ACNOYE_05670 [Nannocystaceae bacterium ST9]